MGCISSKVVSRSLSFHEELRKSLQRTSNRNGGQDEMIISGSSSEQIMALVCPANMIADKLQSRSSNFNSKELTRDTAAGLEEGVGEIGLVSHQSFPMSVRSNDVDVARSKSCHWLSENVDLVTEDRYDWSSNGRVSSRSFHTVEEFDELIQRARQRSYEGENDNGHGYPNVKEKMSENSSIPISSSGSTIKEVSLEKGLKKKSIVKGLESLSVAATIEFPAIGSLRDWVNGGEDIITPKFGSYCLYNHGNEKQSNDADMIFNPELLAAFEDCMEQLKEEEESIIRQIVENLEEENINVKLSKE